MSRRFPNVLHVPRPRVATILAALALLISLGGNAAAAIIISSNNQVAQNTISGHQPPSGDHANLIAGSVDGTDVANDSLTGADVKEASLRGVAHRLYFRAAPSNNPFRTLTVVGPWTVKERCYTDLSIGDVFTVLAVNGPGEAQVGTTYSNRDQSYGNEARGTGLTSGQDTSVLVVGAERGVFTRDWGTVMLRSAAKVAALDISLVSDYRPDLTHCFLYGTATLGV